MSANRAAARIYRITRNQTQYISAPDSEELPPDGARYRELIRAGHKQWDTEEAAGKEPRWDFIARAFKQVAAEIIKEEMLRSHKKGQSR